MSSAPTAPVTPPQEPSNLAAFLSYLIPGLGQIYQGRYAKGILFMVSLLGMFAARGTQLRNLLFTAMAQFVPPSASDLITKTLNEITRGSGGKLSTRVATGALLGRVVAIGMKFSIGKYCKWLRHLFSAIHPFAAGVPA